MFLLCAHPDPERLPSSTQSAEEPRSQHKSTRHPPAHPEPRAPAALGSRGLATAVEQPASPEGRRERFPGHATAGELGDQSVVVFLQPEGQVVLSALAPAAPHWLMASGVVTLPA